MEAIHTQTTELSVHAPDTVKYCGDEHYNSAFKEISGMLDGRQKPDFKRAVFLIEWAYTKGALNYADFCDRIAVIADNLRQFVKAKGVEQYKTSGNYALFEFFTKPHPMNGKKPYIYDFEDFYGAKDYRNVFVTKLLETHTGQCRSMPMLYKILAEEIGAESYLALGPNHLYIKHLDEEGKWVNVELTNGHFSSDSWMISSMDISVESIRKGVYMKELSLEESIAFCLTELSIAYERQYGCDQFALVCTEKSLQYFPNGITTLMQRYNALRDIGIAYQKKHGGKKTAFAVENHRKFKEVKTKIEELGYREMSNEKYKEWLETVQEEQSKRLASSKKQ
jgi:hypothetical protein